MVMNIRRNGLPLKRQAVTNMEGGRQAVAQGYEYAYSLVVGTLKQPTVVPSLNRLAL